MSEKKPPSDNSSLREQQNFRHSCTAKIIALKAAVTVLERALSEFPELSPNYNLNITRQQRVKIDAAKINIRCFKTYIQILEQNRIPTEEEMLQIKVLISLEMEQELKAAFNTNQNTENQDQILNLKAEIKPLYSWLTTFFHSKITRNPDFNAAFEHLNLIYNSSNIETLNYFKTATVDDILNMIVSETEKLNLSPELNQNIADLVNCDFQGLSQKLRLLSADNNIETIILNSFSNTLNRIQSTSTDLSSLELVAKVNYLECYKEYLQRLVGQKHAERDSEAALKADLGLLEELFKKQSQSLSELLLQYQTLYEDFQARKKILQA